MNRKSKLPSPNRLRIVASLSAPSLYLHHQLAICMSSGSPSRTATICLSISTGLTPSQPSRSGRSRLSSLHSCCQLHVHTGAFSRREAQTLILECTRSLKACHKRLRPLLSDSGDHDPSCTRNKSSDLGDGSSSPLVAPLCTLQDACPAPKGRDNRTRMRPSVYCSS